MTKSNIAQKTTTEQNYFDRRLAVKQPIKNDSQPIIIGEYRNQSVKGSSPFGGAKNLISKTV